MKHIRWEERPPVHEPVMIAAFAGWNDAGDAATGAIRYLAEHYDADSIAELDPEDFFDFTATRPHVQMDDDGQRSISWPSTELYMVTLPGDRDVVLVVGTEPHLRWRTFSDELVEVAKELGCRLFVTLGAMVAEVPHSRPVRVVGTVTDPKLQDELDLPPSTYEGPTGIVGVLTTACRDAGVPTASLWAAVPTYVPAAPSPKAALALVEQTARLLGTSLPTTDLEIAAASYERQVSELVAEDDETADYVRTLEDNHDRDIDQPGQSLVEEVERFLRDRGE
ncbi:MAG TPA: PAC2 family protein [Acidimicrobiales bacterium]|nr:PAC2 family protein [Acidimicrobiales bacterium]